MEGNELNVFAPSQCLENEKDDGLNDNISRNNKSGFRHFVEESTLRNVSLDELDEIIEIGDSTSDGNIRRTPSSVSSEPPVLRRCFVLEYSPDYVDTGEFFVRTLIMVVLVASLGTVSNSGTASTDVLDYPLSAVVRFHIYSLVFAILSNATFFFIGISSLIDSFPSYVNKVDALVHFCVFILLLVSSGTLFHLVYIHFETKSPPQMSKSEVSWAFGHLFASSVTGLFCAFNTILLIAFRIFAPLRKQIILTDEIALTALHSS